MNFFPLLFCARRVHVLRAMRQGSRIGFVPDLTKRLMECALRRDKQAGSDQPDAHNSLHDRTVIYLSREW